MKPCIHKVDGVCNCKVGRCEPFRCTLFQDRYMLAESLVKSWIRFKALPQSRQRRYCLTYYGGRQPWEVYNMSNVYAE